MFYLKEILCAVQDRSVESFMHLIWISKYFISNYISLGQKKIFFCAFVSFISF